VRFGDFLSELVLPGAVDEDHIQAEYKDGFLRVTLPKAGTD
jgi:HSP20 family molecular chaperone IbpA